jgi:hypothetical protein
LVEMEQVESPGVPTSPSPQQYPIGYAPPPPMMMEQAKPPATAASSQRWVLIVAAAAWTLCTFLPWINIPIRGSVAGTEGDGWITLGIFALALLITLTGTPGLVRRICIRLAGDIASAIGVYDAANISARKAELAGEGGDLAAALANSIIPSPSAAASISSSSPAWSLPSVLSFVRRSSSPARGLVIVRDRRVAKNRILRWRLEPLVHAPCHAYLYVSPAK